MSDQPNDSQPQPRKKQAALVVTWRDTTYEIRLDQFTAAESLLCRAKCGRGVMAIMASNYVVDVDEAAVLLWLHLRRDDPSLAWEDFADEFGVSDMADVDVRGVDADPEASGRRS